MALLRSEAQVAERTKHPRVLVVDDSAPMRRTVREILEGPPLNAEVLEADDGARALPIALREQLDVIVCDFEMPVMGGIAFLRAIRARSDRLQLPVLLLTAADSLHHKVEGFNNGASDFVTKPFAPAELIARVEAHASLARMHRQLTTLAHTDSLTGVGNRRRFLERLSAEVARAKRSGRQLSMLLLDVDHFKTVNDTYGHPAGDAVLRKLGALLVGQHRVYDDVGRLGGEEFGALLPEVAPRQAVLVAERLRAKVESTTFAELGGGSVTVSIGVAGAAGADADADAELLYKRADEELYRAKNTGRNRVCGAEPQEGGRVE